MPKKAIFKPASDVSQNDSMLVALFIAAIIHVIVLLGVHFSAPKKESFNRSIDITLVNTPTKKAPKEAKFLAPEHQLGSGEAVKKAAPPKQELPSQGESEQKVVNKPTEITSKPRSLEKILTQKIAPQKIAALNKADDGDSEDQPHLNAETLRNQLAQLGTEIRLSQQSSDNQQTKNISQVSAHQFVAAQYQKDWESKVERIGNMNYPEIAAKKNFFGKLTMDVNIRADGSLDKVVVTRSSGHPTLDEAAKNIVKMSAPFAPFPVELMKESKILTITRVWKFSDQSGMSAH